MSTNLEIQDGDPYWWDSPDIWVVPGNNPNGSPGQPIAGEPAFLWARVHNTGKETAIDARVNFYWSNPAAGVLRSNSKLIGSAFVDLAPGETKEVLCINPWIPQIVNDGHECVVSEVIHPSDQLPYPLPDEFDPPMYHQIAQKNLNLLIMKENMRTMTIQIAAPLKKEKVLLMTTEIGGNLDKLHINQFGLKNYRSTKHDSLKVGFSLEPGCDESGKEQLKEEVKIQLKPGAIKAIYLKIRSPELKPQTYILLRAIARDEQKKIVGGITYILIKNKGRVKS